MVEFAATLVFPEIDIHSLTTNSEPLFHSGDM